MAGIVFITDNHYFEYTKVSSLSVALNWDNTKYVNIYIITVDEMSKDAFSDLTAILPPNVKLRLISVYLPNDPNSRYSNICYVKFFIPHLIPIESRLLYLDSDTITVGDISMIFDVNMGNYPIAGVPKEVIKWPFSRFGTGVILFQCEAYKKQDCKNRLLREVPNIIWNADKYAFNKILEGKILPLDRRYNMDPAEYLEMKEDNAHAILHFWGEKKPWSSHTLGDQYWKQYECLLKQNT